MIFSLKGYPTSLLIIEQRKNGIDWYLDRGRFVEKPAQNESFYELKKTKRKIKAINLQYIEPTGKSILYTPNRIDYFPVTLEHNGNLKVIDEDVRMLKFLEDKKDLLRTEFKPPFEKYLAIIMLAVVLIASGVFMLLFLNGLTGMVKEIHTISGALQELSKQTIEALQVIRGTTSPVIRPVPVG